MNKNISSKPIKYVAVISAIIFLILTGITTDAYEIKNVKRKEIDDNIIELDGAITASVFDNYYGLVCPLINLTDKQILVFNTSYIGNNTYLVNSTLKVDIEITKNVSRRFLLGRYLRSYIFIIRRPNNIFSAKNIIDGFLRDRIFITSKINVFSKGNKSIEIPLEYEVVDQSENASMYILCIGTPHSILRRQLPVDFKKINLELVYNLVQNDTFPPFTTCELECKYSE